VEVYIRCVQELGQFSYSTLREDVVRSSQQPSSSPQKVTKARDNVAILGSFGP